MISIELTFVMLVIQMTLPCITTDKKIQIVTVESALAQEGWHDGQFSGLVYFQ